MPQDSAALARLRWLSRSDGERAREPEAAFLPRFEAWLGAAFGSGEWLVCVAETDTAEVVGNMYLRCIGTVPVPGVARRAWGYVTNAFVHPDHRSQGLGGSLLSCLVGLAKEHGLHELHVWPSVGAVSLYRRAGFLSPEQQVASGAQDVPAYLLPLV